MFRSVGFKLFWVGFFLIFAGSLLIVISSLYSDNGVNVGIIVIGPIPIIVGTGSYAFFVVLLLLAIVLTIICVALFFFSRQSVKQ